MAPLEYLQAFLARHLSAARVDVACALGALYVVLKVAQLARRRLKTTDLRGPSSPSFLWGLSKTVLSSPDAGQMYEGWAEEYGGVYEVSWALGGKRLVLCDPKAVAHLFGGEPWTYVLTPFGEIGTMSVVGKHSILSAKGECHRRQRKTLTPAFSNAAIRDLTSVFYDSAYKLQSIWDASIEASGGSVVIEVQKWMNHVSLDTIGIAGFSHDFGSLDGKSTPVAEVFDAFGLAGGNFSMLVVVAQALPWLLKLPTPRSKLFKRLNDAMGEISNELLAKTRKEKEAGTLGESEKSILGLLIKAENWQGKLHLTREEVTAQAKVLLLAGYETTSISLTWALIELAKNPDVQTKLRTELFEFGADPTYDQLSSNLPYLDAVVHETLRMHAPLPDFTRMASTQRNRAFARRLTHRAQAAADDVIPLSEPVRTRSGKLVDHVAVAKGTYLSVSVPSMNRSTALWGPDAKTFQPERWLARDGAPARAREIQGHRHLLTFIDGPRTCLGKGFAIAEFKIVLSVLVRRYAFALRDGPGTAIEMTGGILPRPRVAGEAGTAVPLCVMSYAPSF